MSLTVARRPALQRQGVSAQRGGCSGESRRPTLLTGSSSRSLPGTAHFWHSSKRRAERSNQKHGAAPATQQPRDRAVPCRTTRAQPWLPAVKSLHQRVRESPWRASGSSQMLERHCLECQNKTLRGTCGVSKKGELGKRLGRRGCFRSTESIRWRPLVTKHVDKTSKHPKLRSPYNR